MSIIYARTHMMLGKIEKLYATCQEYAQLQLTTNFILRDDVDFKHNIYIEMFYNNEKSVPYAVDEATWFQAMRWLLNVSADSQWKALQECRIHVFLGPPDITVHDADKNFRDRTFSQVDMMNITTNSTPVEYVNQTSNLEIYIFRYIHHF